MPVTALCRTPGRARVSGRAQTYGSGSQDHGPLWTQTWPRRRPPLPPTAPCRLPVQEDSIRRPLAAEARLQSLGLALPAPGVHYGKCSPQCTAAAGRGGSRVWAEPRAGPDPGRGSRIPLRLLQGPSQAQTPPQTHSPGWTAGPNSPDPLPERTRGLLRGKETFLSSLA